jgi:formylglycine-generating enzyme required for sulfatase activity
VSRVYLINDLRGARELDDSHLPLSLGGEAVADIVLHSDPAERVDAYIALSDGHAYLQAADGTPLFHNHRQVSGSVWLKSGDQVQAGEAVLYWSVQGDQVRIDVRPHPAAADAPAAPVVDLQPPLNRPPLPRSSATTEARGPVLVKRLALAMLGLLVLAAAFVLLATPIEVRVSPPAVYEVSGFPPPVPLGQRMLVWPGQYRVKAALDGYYALDEELDVARGGFRRFELKLRELPGEVEVRVQPAVPFRLLVDGRPVTVDADGVARIERGQHRLRVESDRYLPAGQDIDVAGLGASQQVGFNLQPAWADVRIDSRPAGARVSVDGEPLGSTPLDTEVLQGEHEIVLHMQRYKPLVVQQAVVAGAELVLDELVLEPADGQIALASAPPAVAVQVDGEYRGTTPLSLNLASTRDHELRLSKPGYTTLERTVRVQPEQQQALELKLDRQYGTLFITADPADAELRVDGKPSGKATRRLRLSTAKHRLEVYKPGYVSEVIEITPRADASRNLDVTLKKPQQAARKQLADTLRTSAGQRLRLVRPSGPFELGASRREAGRRANESRRLVELARPFYLSEQEVTNAQYRRFKAAHVSGSAEGESLDGADQPVVNVDWDDAARYCNWLSAQDGLPAAYRKTQGHMQLIRPVTTGYRLPTEVEWAYAARLLGRTQSARYPWAGDFPPSQVVANFADARIGDTLAETVPGYDDGYRVSAPVGSFAAGPAGFYDLGGNAAEWMTDYYKVYPGEADRLVKDPLGPESGRHHVVRGSSWRHGNITELRWSYRDYSKEARNDLGFRLARYAE